MPTAADDFQTQWRDRLASGSKLSSKALSQALKDDPSRLPLIIPLTQDARTTVRVCALRALEELGHAKPQLLAPYAREIVEALASPELDAQGAALGALTCVAPYARAETALALPLVAELLAAKRPALREEAARCLGRLGSESPENAALAAIRLADALRGSKSPRAAQEAREILAALEGMLPHLGAADRAGLAPAVSPLRAHPNIQVRERAGRLSRLLTT